MISFKTYGKFCSLSINPKTKKGGLDTKTYLNEMKSYRYGIEIEIKLDKYFTKANEINHPSSSTVPIKLTPKMLE